MKPILTVEFSTKIGEEDYKEESIPLHNTAEFFDFVAPNGGCETIPEDVSEIRMVFLSPEHPNTQNPVADVPATLQLGMILFNGPLSEISSTAEQLLDKAGRGELSQAFMISAGIPCWPDQVKTSLTRQKERKVSPRQTNLGRMINNLYGKTPTASNPKSSKEAKKKIEQRKK